jgi:hypothetical protein
MPLPDHDDSSLLVILFIVLPPVLFPVDTLVIA